MGSMRKALCVGINYYTHLTSLNGCINDAETVGKTLERNEDDSANFGIKFLFANDENSAITEKELRNNVKALFSGEPEIALFYFSGHGGANNNTGYLCTSEIKDLEDCYPLTDLMNEVSNSKAKNKIIILDSCFCGKAGTHALLEDHSILKNDTIILSACDSNQCAMEKNGHGVFTSLLVEALKGGAMNLLGEVSPGSIYSYIDRSLGAWEQRPVFKANIKSFISLRKNNPPISIKELRMITNIFKEPNIDYPLDPTYEPDKHESKIKKVDKDHEAIFDFLQRCVHLNLVVPVGEKHMYYAAIHNKSCKLTAQGRHYWHLINNKTI